MISNPAESKRTSNITPKSIGFAIIKLDIVTQNIPIAIETALLFFES
ncbi:MAG: hypothetical protein ACPKPY_00840 [Nitrososphaeraceae archaeon]